MINFGQQLTLALKKADRSQKWLAYTIDVNPNLVSKWTKKEDARLSTVCRICDALDISVAEFLNIDYQTGNGYTQNHGRQPVDGHVEVDVIFRDGDTDNENDQHIAGYWDWSLGGDYADGDIIAYRVIEQE